MATEHVQNKYKFYRTYCVLSINNAAKTKASMTRSSFTSYIERLGNAHGSNVHMTSNGSLKVLSNLLRLLNPAFLCKTLLHYNRTITKTPEYENKTIL